MGEISLFEPFALDTGLAGPFRLAVKGPGDAEPDVREFRSPFVIVGREPPADLILDHPEVSRRHAYLQIFAGQVFAVDLDSRTGICWRNGPHASGWVNRGDRIYIGPYEIHPLSGGTDVAAHIPPPTSRDFPLIGAPPVALEVTGSGLDRKTWQLRRALVLFGRASGCRMRLGPETSRFHAALVRTATGAWMVDLLAPGGFTVNGASARCTRLADGDRICIDRYRIGVRLGGPSEFYGVEPHPPAAESQLLASRGTIPDPVLASIVEEFGRRQDQMTDQFQQTLIELFRLFTGMHQDQMTLIREELSRIHELTAEQQSLLARLASPPTMPAPEKQPVLRIVGTGRSYPPDVQARSHRATSGNPSGLLPQKSDTPSVDMHHVLTQRLAAIDNERQGRWQKLLNSCLGKSQESG